MLVESVKFHASCLTDRRSAACGDLPGSTLNTWEGLDSSTPRHGWA